MKLRQAEEKDLSILSTWFNNQKEATLWGGPTIRFPIDASQLKEDLLWEKANSFSLVEGCELLGFAQMFDRFGYNHLGRIAIHPQKRGRKLGYKLVTLIFESDLGFHQDYSLYVYEDNPTAIRLYQNLGFEFHAYPNGVPERKGSLFMVKKSNQT